VKEQQVEDPRGYVVIPDLHGHAGRLMDLIEVLERERVMQGRKFVFLGDYVDRGPRIRELIDLLVDFQRQGHICLAGNHEYTLRRALEPGAHDAWVQHWAEHYEENVLVSYGVSPGRNDTPRLLAMRLRNRMGTHVDFLESLPLVFEAPGLICVHAGLHPEVPWEEQLRHLRSQPLVAPDELYALFSHDLAAYAGPTAPACVVTGHYIRWEPLVTEHRVLLHGGVEVGGKLHAYISDERRVVSV
jgi:serine/threonine protein phosphatase 1